MYPRFGSDEVYYNYVILSAKGFLVDCLPPAETDEVALRKLRQCSLCSRLLIRAQQERIRRIR